MSEKQSRGNIDLAKYNSMSTEELEEILRSDAEMPEGQESDGELILYVMEVLAKRKRNSHTGKTALEAYESFQKNYMPENKPAESAVPVKTGRRCPRWIRSLTAVAAVIAVLLAGSVTVKAFGFDIWVAVIQWTQETFHFGEWGNSNSNNDLPYASLQEALKKGNIPAWLVPTYVPEGFDLTDIKVEQSPKKKKYTAKYTSGEDILVIAVRDHIDKSPVFVEQKEGLTEEYTVAGIAYYLFENNEQNQAVWIVDSYECCISGNITIDELKMMINSVKKD